MDDLTDLERNLLLRLCGSQVTLSAVLVAADWWEKPGDPDYSLVVWLLEGLGERGLITYRLGAAAPTVPVYIRVTPAGYDEAGFPIHHAVNVGLAHRSYKGEHARNALDRTDFRTHGEFAVGEGPIEKMPLEDHLREYPDHRFNKGRFFVTLSTPAGTTVPSEFRTIIEAAKRQGWKFGRTSAGHTTLTNPDTGAVVNIPGTPGDNRTFYNTRAQLMRAGLILQGRRPKEWADELPDVRTSPARKETPVSALAVTPEGKLIDPLAKVADPLVRPNPFALPTPKVTSTIDGVLVNGKPAPKPEPPRQNEKVETPPRVWPLLTVIRAKVLDREQHERAAKMLEEAAKLVGDDALTQHIESEALEVLDRVKLSPVEQEYHEFAKAVGKRTE